jgi:iron complex transport system substrate-binding protein
MAGAKQLRIVSLIPSATEIVYKLGLGNALVARSHDSNYPPEALHKPVLSEPAIDVSGSSAEIDNAVRTSLHTGRSIFHVDQQKLAELKPDLILTQELCKVCAPSFTDVQNAAKILDGEAKIISLEPHSLEEMMENVALVGRMTGTTEKAEEEIKKMRARLDAVEEKVKNANMPSIAVIEWLEPLMTAGHWVPEMAERAGGKIVLSKTREKSKPVAWEQIAEADPDVLIVAPCGFDIARTRKEIGILKAMEEWEELSAVCNGRAWLVDGDAYLTRSGPRLVDGVEILAKILHPKIFGEPQKEEAERI